MMTSALHFSARRLVSLVPLLVALGCRSTPGPLPTGGRSVLAAPLPPDAQTVYTGLVTPNGAAAPQFRYQRTVSHRPGTDAVDSFHITWAVDSLNAPLVHQHARHRPDFSLLDFEEAHVQTGIHSRVTVAADGGVRFERSNGGVSREGPGDAVVVGPTLFGYALVNWERLARGERLPIRFAVASAGRTYPFVLVLERRAGVSRVWMKPNVWWLRFFTHDIWFDVEPDARQVTQYQGPVPPLWKGDAVDARARYVYDATGPGLMVAEAP